VNLVHKLLNGHYQNLVLLTVNNNFNLDDPKGISEEGSWEWKSGTKGTMYKVKFDKNVNLDYIMFLIKQKYDSLK
jgi:predicted transport protein